MSEASNNMTSDLASTSAAVVVDTPGDTPTVDPVPVVDPSGAVKDENFNNWINSESSAHGRFIAILVCTILI